MILRIASKKRIASQKLFYRINIEKRNFTKRVFRPFNLGFRTMDFVFDRVYQIQYYVNKKILVNFGGSDQNLTRMGATCFSVRNSKFSFDF